MKGLAGDRQQERAPSNLLVKSLLTISKESTHLSESRDTRFSSGLWLRAV